MGKNKREGVEIDSEMSSGEDAGHQDTNQAINSAKLQKSEWRKFIAYVGPGFLVCIAYVDPGNLQSDLQAGARYKYELLWIVLVASCFALIIQSLAANLGVATVIGTAFALNMLSGIPVLGGVLLTGASTLILLALQRYGIRKLEFVIAILLFTMAGCFFGELGFAKPKFTQVLKGTFVPQLRGNGATGLAISLLGALVIPHNIFLHSALVLLRKIPQSVSGINSVCRYNLMESAFALSLACMINIAVISVSGVLCNSPTLSSENKHNCSDLDVTKSSFLLKHVLGGWSAKVFSIALLASGQSSTITGTYAGQYVMQGFLDLKLTAWLRNLMTRCIAIIPSLIVSTISGSSGAGNLIIISSMILSFDLPFVLIPLLKFTGNKAKMGSHKNSITITVITWGLGLCIIGINMYYVITAFVGCLIHNNLPKAVSVLIGLIVVPAIVLYVLEVVYLAFRPTKKVTYVASEEVPIEI